MTTKTRGKRSHQGQEESRRRLPRGKGRGRKGRGGKGKGVEGRKGEWRLQADDLGLEVVCTEPWDQGRKFGSWCFAYNSHCSTYYRCRNKTAKKMILNKAILIHLIINSINIHFNLYCEQVHFVLVFWMIQRKTRLCFSFRAGNTK